MGTELIRFMDPSESSSSINVGRERVWVFFNLDVNHLSEARFSLQKSKAAADPQRFVELFVVVDNTEVNVSL